MCFQLSAAHSSEKSNYYRKPGFSSCLYLSIINLALASGFVSGYPFIVSKISVHRAVQKKLQLTNPRSYTDAAAL